MLIGQSINGFTIGQYPIKSNIDQIKLKRELSSQECEMIGLTFKGERIFNTPRAEKFGTKWDTIIGVINKKVYKITAVSDEMNANKLNSVFKAVFSDLKSLYGQPSQHMDAGVNGSVDVWILNDGNIVLNRVKISNQIQISITSDIAIKEGIRK